MWGHLSEKQYHVFKLKNVHIYCDAQSVEVSGHAISLTRLEYRFLVYMVENKNRAISREELLNEIWQIEQPIETRATDDTVKRLHKKLRAAHAQIEIETIRGFGFIIKKNRA
ncbi:winged helix-turn-helix domain-containing protein [Fusibacter ferrireducens]|uniref:Winged helix-turn-helix transcriptional regulator n=1 Tax=Fusibacter ferrireducens TaxID=2785058 RepID=A0ABR9ZYX6_9FIRM|nr:winged helix-turn-helix domain-containing protein [Fusibacter ferrireducens]MBF4695667.1 winged helix-turn-helix transcriptional regulator [Fusibacter ferrireducens]